MVIIYYPSKRCNPYSPSYPDYCKYALLRYREWKDDPQNAFEHPFEDISELPEGERYKKVWEAFVKFLVENGSEVPDVLAQEMEMVMQTSRSNPDKEFEDDSMPEQDAEQDDFMEIANTHIPQGYDDSDEVEITWDQDFDFTVPVQDWSNDNAPVPSPCETFDQMCRSREHRVMEPHPDRKTLLEKQQNAHDMVVKLVARKDDGSEGEKQGLIIGRGGTGKSTTINEIHHTVNATYGPGSTMLLATTGKAATVIGGATVHSAVDGLSLPVGGAFQRMKDSKSLDNLQQKWDKVKLLFIDEFTMLRQRELHYIDQRLRQLKGNNYPFGGIAVILVGDPAQLPPVGGRSLWDNSLGLAGDDSNGWLLYRQYFSSVVILDTIRRLDMSDASAEIFQDILDRLRDGNNTKEDWLEMKKQCREEMSPAQWKAQFEDPNSDVTKLFTTNKEVNNENHTRLNELGEKIVLINAKNTGNARKMDSSNFRGLMNSVYLSVGCKITLTTNVLTSAGLANGTVGIVKEFEYEDGVQAPNLPKCVWIDFGEKYTGSTFFPNNAERSGWVPILPITFSHFQHSNTAAEGYTESTRTMFPLRLAYSWTIWKAQGQTIKGKVAIHLGLKEKEHGLTYVAMSRVQRLSDIGILSVFTLQRFTDSIKKHKKMKGRISEEKRLAKLAEETLQQLAA